MQRNCACPGCCNLISSGKYCAKHEGDARYYRPHEVKYVTQYQSSYPKYDTRVGHPEARRNKI